MWLVQRHSHDVEGASDPRHTHDVERATDPRHSHDVERAADPRHYHDVERAADPNWGLQTDTFKEYTKKLPVWIFRGWDPLVSNVGVSFVKYRRKLGSRNRKNNDNRCTRLNKKNVNQKDHSYSACHIEFGEVHSASDGCSMNDCSENVQTSIPSSSCIDKETSSDKLVSDVKSDSDTSVPVKCDQGNVNDRLSSSEESGDEVTCPPAGMHPTLSCRICLESYSHGDLLCGLPCGHNYHKCCIIQWLHKGSHDDCPVCRWPAWISKQSLSHPHQE